LIDRWVDQSATEYSGTCPGNIAAGAARTIRMEFYENGGDASAMLSWSSDAGMAKQIIPAYNGTMGLAHDDLTRPTLVSASAVCGASNQIVVEYSEPVDSTTATAIGNYA